MSKSIIYSILLHVILALYLILSFNLTKEYDESKNLHVKIEVTDAALTMLNQEKEQVLPQKEQLDKKIDDIEPKTKDKDIAPKKKKTDKPKENSPIIQKENNPIKAAKKVEKKILPSDNNVSKASPPVAAKESKKKTINQKTSTKKAATTKVKKTQEAVVKKDSSKDSPLNTNLDANKEQVIADNKINQNFNNEESQNNTQEEIQKITELQKKIEEKEFQLAQKSISGLNLSNREKFNLYSQIKSCFKRSLLESEDSKEKILVKINIDIDGYIESDISDLEEMANYKKENKDQFIIAVNNAKRAIKICNPLRGLPIDKHDIWKEIILEFSQEKINNE